MKRTRVCIIVLKRGFVKTVRRPRALESVWNAQYIVDFWAMMMKIQRPETLDWSQYSRKTNARAHY